MKKVLIRRFDREPLSGYVNPQTYLLADGVELMTQEGGVARVPYVEVKLVCFVRDFDAESEQERKLFATRPKTEGLWVRMELRDGEVMDGILSNNLLQIEPTGFTVVPPDAYSNNQRLFIPRAALSRMQVVGVVGSPLKAKKPKPLPKDQPSLFE